LQADITANWFHVPTCENVFWGESSAVLRQPATSAGINDAAAAAVVLMEMA
jgi:hypothetical protein